MQAINDCKGIFQHIGKNPVLDRHIQEVRKELDDPKFTYEKVKNCSRAASVLFMWIKDVVDFENQVNAKQ